MKITESNLTEQFHTPVIVVNPKVTFEFYEEGFSTEHLILDARSIDKRAGYADLTFDEFCPYGYVHLDDSVCCPRGVLDPNEQYKERKKLFQMDIYGCVIEDQYNFVHLYDYICFASLYLEEFAYAVELIKLNKEHILIFDNCLATLELTYKPKEKAYVVTKHIEKKNITEMRLT